MTDTKEPPAAKRTCIRSAEDPDVTIVVGGETFHEYSSALRCWSEYFDKALRSGMQESKSKHFEFPDRNPREWEWIVSIMAPLSKEKISTEKLDIALSWYDELCSPLGLEECDRVICADCTFSKKAVKALVDSNNAVKALVDSLVMAFQFGLHHSKYKCFELLKDLVQTKPELLTEENLKSILNLVRDHQDGRKEMFPSLQVFLPESMSSAHQDLLLENGILHHYLYSEIGRRTLPKNIGKILDTHIGINCEPVSYRKIRRELRKDKSIGHLMPDTW